MTLKTLVLSFFGHLNHMIIDNKKTILICDLYWLRFRKPGAAWFELTDYLRDCLIRDFGMKIRYTKDDLIVGNFSVKHFLREIEK